MAWSYEKLGKAYSKSSAWSVSLTPSLRLCVQDTKRLEWRLKNWRVSVMMLPLSCLEVSKLILLFAGTSDAGTLWVHIWNDYEFLSWAKTAEAWWVDCSKLCLDPLSGCFDRLGPRIWHIKPAGPASTPHLLNWSLWCKNKSVNELVFWGLSSKLKCIEMRTSSNFLNCFFTLHAVLYFIFLVLPPINFILSPAISNTSPMMYFQQEFNYLERQMC